MTHLKAVSLFSHAQSYLRGLKITADNRALILNFLIMFQKFIEQPRTILEVKVNLERAINELRKFYSEKFQETIYTEGCDEISRDFYNSMHSMEAMHNIKLTLK